ncbi:zinc finger, CCHC-type containing protein [Tanacetum coccineum]
MIRWTPSWTQHLGVADLPTSTQFLVAYGILSKEKLKVDLTKEFLLSRFSMKDMWEADVILGIRIKHKSNGISISQSLYIEKVLKKFNYFDCTPVSTPMDIMGKLSRYTSNPGYTDASWISNTEDNSSTRVFLLGGGAISWASKKQTCITGSITESKFLALVTTGKEAEWLRNLILEIPLWYKPIAHIFIRCDSAATLAKAYSQMYNWKSTHLGVRHSMIREMITNGVVSIEFVRSQQNLADHLTKGVARDLVIKSVEGMGLKELKHMYLCIIPRMCLEPAEKEDEVRVGERQRPKDEPKLLDTTVGRVVQLLPVAPARASSELEARVDKLFDEGGNGGQTDQGDSVSGRHGVGIPQLREDHKTSTGSSVAGKSMSALQRLLAGAVLNLEVGIVALPTLPFITSYVSVTPE